MVVQGFSAFIGSALTFEATEIKAAIKYLKDTETMCERHIKQCGKLAKVAHGKYVHLLTEPLILFGWRYFGVFVQIYMFRMYTSRNDILFDNDILVLVLACP